MTLAVLIHEFESRILHHVNTNDNSKYGLSFVLCFFGKRIINRLFAFVTYAEKA